MPTEHKVFNKEYAETMYNIVELAPKLEREKFYNYNVTGNVQDSQELIAVEFNTDNPKNVGFIDEYGNVIKEPFLEDPYYDYYEKENGKISVKQYYKDYYYDTNSQIFYDRNFHKIALTEIELKEYSKEKYNWIQTKNITDEQSLEKIKKTLDDLLIMKYDSLSADFNDEIYCVSFVKKGLGSCFTILLDDKYDLVMNLYYFDGNENQFEYPRRGSKVGCAFVRGLGKVYYNIYGEIIWITYAKE